MNQQTTLFSNEKLMAMIIPLFLEQLLIMLVGMADTLVVSYAGEAAVSGVSLVNQFNTIFIYLFTALASGGAVVISQYIGRKKNDDAGESASQLLSFSTIFSILIAVMVLIGNEGMLRLMFGTPGRDCMPTWWICSRHARTGRSENEGGFYLEKVLHSVKNCGIYIIRNIVLKERSTVQ